MILTNDIQVGVGGAWTVAPFRTAETAGVASLSVVASHVAFRNRVSPRGQSEAEINALAINVALAENLIRAAHAAC